MYQDKVKEWLEGDARKSFKRISQSQFSVLVSFAGWLDRAAELQRVPAEPEQPCPMCDGKGFNREYGRTVWCEVCDGTGKSDRSGRG